MAREAMESRSERWLLVGLWAVTFTALAGYAVFGRHPALVAELPSALAALYAPSFALFAQGQVWVAGVVLVAMLIRRAGASWVSGFILVYAASLCSELMGTTWGLPFGAYAYTSLLGPMWLDRVPVVIPLSWYAMALPSYAMARAVYPHAAIGRTVLGSLILLSWDLALDPAMSAATPYWAWGEAGVYYGMPLLNLFGWYVTGVMLMVLLAWRDDGWVARVPLRWLLSYYGANAALAVGMCAAAGLWGAVLATTLVVLGWGGWSAARIRRERSRSMRARLVYGALR